MPSPYRMSKFSVLWCIMRLCSVCSHISFAVEFQGSVISCPCIISCPSNYSCLWSISSYSGPFFYFFLNRLYCVFDSFRFTENLSRKYRDSCVSPDTICTHPPPSSTSPTGEGRLLQPMNLHRCPVTTQNL